MTTKEERRFCVNCDELTRHEIERNQGTGWHRERCQNCNLTTTKSPHKA